MDFRYTVEGSWPFPIDMLRHDGAVAATPEDQEKIDRLSSEFAPDVAAIRNSTSISLIIRNMGRRRPNTARWCSFGWTVPDDTDYRAAAEWRATQARMKALRSSALAKLTKEERTALDWFGARTIDDSTP